MSESSDETPPSDDPLDDIEAEDIQILRRRVEEKFDFNNTPNYPEKLNDPRLLVDKTNR
jgi:hypothetical protein